MTLALVLKGAKVNRPALLNSKIASAAWLADLPLVEAVAWDFSNNASRFATCLFVTQMQIYLLHFASDRSAENPASRFAFRESLFAPTVNATVSLSEKRFEEATSKLQRLNNSYWPKLPSKIASHFYELSVPPRTSDSSNCSHQMVFIGHLRHAHNKIRPSKALQPLRFNRF